MARGGDGSCVEHIALLAGPAAQSLDLGLGVAVRQTLDDEPQRRFDPLGMDQVLGRDVIVAKKRDHVDRQALRIGHRNGPPTGPGDEIGPGHQNRPEVAHAGVATVLQHDRARFDPGPVDTLAAVARRQHEIAEATAARIEARMKTPVGSRGTGRTDHRAIHQRQAQRIPRRQPAPVFQKALQKVLQPVPHLAETAEHALVAQGDDFAVSRHRRGAAKRQQTRPIHHRKPKQIRRLTDLPDTLQGTEPAGRLLQIGNLAQPPNNRRPISQIKGSPAHPKRESHPSEPQQGCRFAPMGRGPDGIDRRVSRP